MNLKKNTNSIVFSITAVVVTVLCVCAFLNRDNSKYTIKVSGTAARNFSSDYIVWSGNFSRESQNLRQAFYLIKKDLLNVRKYLLAKGIKPEEMQFHTVQINSNHNPSDASKQHINGYLLAQTVEIHSKEIALIENIAKDVTDLIDFGIVFYSNPPTYYYSKIGALKLELIKEATANARIRAEKIAEGANAGLGELKDAKMGIFQIAGKNLYDEEKYSLPSNVSSKEKTISLTMKLKFGIN
jgi:hypothetical protein